jgi:hypothetical protein
LAGDQIGEELESVVFSEPKTPRIMGQVGRREAQKRRRSSLIVAGYKKNTIQEEDLYSFVVPPSKGRSSRPEICPLVSSVTEPHSIKRGLS